MSASPTPPEKAPSARSKTPRVWFVDALRLMASFQMVNGHTLHEVLEPELREGSGYALYLWFRGLVAVAFLLVSGIAFHLSTVARFEKHKAQPKAVERRFRRAAIIMAFGYALYLPLGAFSGDPALTAEAWRHFFSLDVLICIGATLVCLELLVLLSRSPRQVTVLAGLGAMAFFLAAPAADAVITDGQPHFFANWISHQGGSQFPLFPWAGYVFAGVVVGGLVLPQAGHTKFRKSATRMLLLVGAAYVASLLIEPLSDALFDPSRHHPQTDPAQTAERLFAVLMLLLVLDLLCRPVREFPRFLRILSAQTLTIYVFHLYILIYGPLSLGPMIGKVLSLPQALALSAVNLTITASFAIWWHGFQKRGGFRGQFARWRRSPGARDEA